MTPVQSETLIFSQAASAFFNRSRPIFQPDEWDPGPWSQYRLTLPELLAMMPNHELSPFRQPLSYESSRPSAIPLEMKELVDQLRELLYVEEIKAALAVSRGETAAQVFW